VDPITVSVIQHRFQTILVEIGEAMLRTSYSQILNATRDFSIAVADRSGDLVAQAEHVPIHAGGLPWAVRGVRDFFGDRVQPNDVYLLNDPYHGGNHLPDLTVLVPVFVDGQLVFWIINRSHQSDIGGAAHGAYNARAYEIWQEGIRITPLRLYEAGALRDDLLHMLAANVRHARDFRGDLAAMVGSARLGERRVQGLIGEYGLAKVDGAVEAVRDSAEEQARACVAAWRDGVYYGESVIDDDGQGGRDIHVRARVTKRASDVVVDLAESDPQAPSFINSSYANMRSSVAMAFAFLIDPHIPKNAGTFRPLSVAAKAGTVVWANPPAPVTMCTSHCGQDISDAVLRALAPASPKRSIAGWSRRFRIAIQGIDPRTRRSFIWHLFHARPGGGAFAEGDGWPCGGEGQVAGSVKFGSVEVTEVRFPLFLRRHEFRPGVGSVLEMAVEIDQPALANTAGDGTRHAPYGLFGGREGLPHRYRLRSGRRERVLRTKEVGIVVRPGDVFLIESSGGGGWGPPRRRSPEARAADLKNGLVTRSRRTARVLGKRRSPARRGT
jgi:N-methylhydantoinase B